MYDVVVIGGGPAGLSAALLLGRSRRVVLVCDAGAPRNAASSSMHGYLSRDGMHPSEFLDVARKELAAYDTVKLRAGKVVAVTSADTGYEVTLDDGTQSHCRKLIIATGVVDELPALEGFAPLYGKSVFHCPYCDAWEYGDKPVAVYGRGKSGFGLALKMKNWSGDVALCTDGPAELTDEEIARAAGQGIHVYSERIARLDGNDGCLREVVFEGGPSLQRDALFFSTGNHPRSVIATGLGCKFDEKGAIETDRNGLTCVPGIYVVGDASASPQMVIIAAAEGAQAAIAINEEILMERGLC